MSSMTPAPVGKDHLPRLMHVAVTMQMDVTCKYQLARDEYDSASMLPAWISSAL